MRFFEMKKIGVTALLIIAATSAFSVDANAASNKNNVECKMAATTEPMLIHYQQADGTAIEGRCFDALNNSQVIFDQTVDKLFEEDDFIGAALNSMKKDAKTNPEAAKMRALYLESRAQFMNEFLKDNNLTKLGTKNDQMAHGRDYEDIVRSYISKDDVMARIKALKAPLHNQAEKMIKIKYGY